MCYVKEVFLEILQNPQDSNTELPAQACKFIKKEILTQLFSCEFLRTPFSYRTPPVVVSVEKCCVIQFP